MKKLVFTAVNGKKVIFDEFTDEREQDYNGVWCGICKDCADKYHEELRGHFDHCGSGCCSVCGCSNEADYYVDFWRDENIEIIDD